ncbi:MAG: hypothetical protein OXI77_09760 [Chloroflexota bacterium]|nr:hypothetical protein [Chloroflexota bacterium]MDE2908646.1 hypothetical protein [Chloroflexota bacterium]
MQKIISARELIKSRPNVSLAVFVIIVVAVSVTGYARYQHVQAELAAQQTLLAKFQKGFSHWRDDLSMRFSDLKVGVQGTTQGATNVIGGAWGIVSYLVAAVLDFIGNLHIMIPVTIIYFGVGFFGTLKMRVATLVGALIAFWISTGAGIVQGSVIGLLAIAGLLLLNKFDPRLLTAIQGLPARLKAKLQQMRASSDTRSTPESESVDEAADARG